MLPLQTAVPVYHDLILKACREAGFVPNAPYEADHLHLVLGMVAAGSGVALVPASARRMKQFRLEFVARFGRLLPNSKSLWPGGEKQLGEGEQIPENRA